MTNSAPTQGPVVVGFDGSDGAGLALRWAVAEAARRDRRLLIAQVFEWAPPAVEDRVTAADFDGERIRRHARQLLEDAADECRRMAPEVTVETAAPEGPAAATLARVAADREAPLLVIGSSGISALPRVLLGSTAADLARSVDVPLVVVRTGPGGDELDTEVADHAPVIVGADGSANSDPAVGFAFDFAHRHGVPLRAVHALSDLPPNLLTTGPVAGLGPQVGKGGMQPGVSRQLDQHGTAYPDVDATLAEVPNPPAHALLDAAQGARLLVVGSHGRGRVRRAFLGSVSHAVLYHAPCPVAVLRSDRP